MNQDGRRQFAVIKRSFVGASDLSCLGLRLHEDFQGRADHYHASKKSHFAHAVVK
jgi:hypothetical protein